MTNSYENKLWKLLEKENLTDLSQFHQPGCCDEVPLFSRESDLKFLQVEKAGANEILLGFALKFLNSVIAYEEHETGYFAAITLWNSSVEPLVPNLFVWCGDIEDLEKTLALDTVTTSFATQIETLISRLYLGGKFQTREDTLTDPEATRVFIGPERPPYNGFASLAAFGKQKQAAT